MEGLKFTKTQQKILDVLSDGLPHQRKELWACCPSVSGFEDERQLNEFARLHTNRHLIDIRAKLRQAGHDIVCEIVSRRLCYRHVKLLKSNGDSSSAVRGAGGQS